MVGALARSLKGRHPEVNRVIWFGSWIDGSYSPGSDVDLCIVISESKKKPRDRIPDFLPRSFPVGLDLHIYTQTELQALSASHPELYEAIMSGEEQ
jgi:predicted nucleotidyltransferase